MRGAINIESLEWSVLLLEWMTRRMRMSQSLQMLLLVFVVDFARVTED